MTIAAYPGPASFTSKVCVYTFTIGGHEIVNSLTVTISIR
jgi:hypothetical protein